MIKTEPDIQVGILSAKEIRFHLSGLFHVYATPAHLGSGNLLEDLSSGDHDVEIRGGLLLWKGGTYMSLRFQPQRPEDTFYLEDVTIGKDFHWQRQEQERFWGSLKLIVKEDQITAINTLPLERYLECVISSEMSANAHLELLKAHAIISRSWLLAQILHKSDSQESCLEQIPGGWKRWYNHTSHQDFDVCADDHCQRYQGISRIQNDKAREAVRQTYGKVLMHQGAICDARYAKCCGGKSEIFSACWQDENPKYLQAVRDDKDESPTLDLSQEENAKKWILDRPGAFCATRDKAVLSQILNSYDQETEDFYRWSVTYYQEELSGLIHRKSGVDIGLLMDLKPLKRGESGRIELLQIIGSKTSLTIGKELEIRRILSTSHLKSSAFIIETGQDEKGRTFTLKGAGWGHGVGLCQIGAAMMALEGYSHENILSHYYKSATLEQLY